MASSSPPHKRPRLKGPDGFQVSKLISKHAHKPPPKFVSAFHQPKAETKVPIDKPQRSKNSAPVWSLAHKIKGNEKPSSILSKRSENPFTTANNLEADTSRALIVNRPTLDSLFIHPPAISCQNPHSAPLRPLKPPSFVITTPADASSSSKSSSLSILKPPQLPQPTTKTIILKPLAPPAITFISSIKPSTKMMTISSFATDPTKDGAGADLLSLFLQQHGHNFTSPFDREIQRGIGFSPRKNKTGKGNLIRGGLAERAQHRISCSTTDHILWHRQLEQKLSSASPTAPIPSCDMRFRILRVLLLPPRTPTPARVYLAVCRVSSRHKLANVSGLTDQCYVVLLPHVAGADSSQNFIEEGRNVLAWMPWFKAMLSAVVPRETLQALSVEPLVPPRSVIIAPRWHIMRAD